MRESDESTAAPETRQTRVDAETFAVQQLRAMEQPNWSEGRLDDLNRKVDTGIGRLDDERKELRGEMREGFNKVDEEFKAVRTEMREGFTKVDDEFKAVRTEMRGGFTKIDDEFKAVRAEIKSGFDRMHQTLISGAVAVIVALIGAVVAAPHL